MTRDDLIERLAEIEYHREGSWYPSKPLWDEMTEDQKRHTRASVERYLPVFVAFVETWIEQDGDYEDDAVDRAKRWREEMGAE